MTYAKTPTGCRPAQLVGLWAIEPQAFEALYAQAMHVLESDQYETVARQSRELADEDRAEPYQLDSGGVAHFTVNGPLTRYPHSMQAVTGGTSTLLLAQALRRAKADPDVRGAMLHVDSPGGHSAVQADMRSALADFRAAKPLAAHISGSGCSAAYGIAAECDHVSADPAAAVGSVGTLLALRDTSELMKRAGVKPVYVATGDRKAATAPGVAISDATVDDLRKYVTDAGAGFREAVRERRPGITEDGMKDVLRGGVYAGTAAKDIGLVDAVADTESAVRRFHEQLSSPGNRSLPAEPTLTPAAAQTRSSLMALSPEQMAQAKALPGCADITAENAAEKLLAVTNKLIGTVSDTIHQRDSLREELESLKSQVQQATPPQAVLKAMAAASRIHLQNAVAKQAITPAVAEALASSLIGTDEQLSAVGLTPSATGECVASIVFAALAGNGAAPLIGKVPDGQPAPKTIAGRPDPEPDAVAQARAEAEEYQSRQLASRGLK